MCGDQCSLLSRLSLIYPLGIHVVMKSARWSVGRSTGLEQTLWNPWQDGGLKGRQLEAVSCLGSRNREKRRGLNHCQERSERSWGDTFHQ